MNLELVTACYFKMMIVILSEISASGVGMLKQKSELETWQFFMITETSLSFLPLVPFYFFVLLIKCYLSGLYFCKSFL